MMNYLNNTRRPIIRLSPTGSEGARIMQDQELLLQRGSLPDPQAPTAIWSPSHLGQGDKWLSQ